MYLYILEGHLPKYNLLYLRKKSSQSETKFLFQPMSGCFRTYVLFFRPLLFLI